MNSFIANKSAEEPEIVVRVMIVDDSAVIRGSIARAMEGDPSFKIVSSISNGESAIRSLTREPVDVIVLDIEMPIMDGLTALPQLKAIDPAVQIIMASTLTQKNAEITLRAMSLGATDYIPKPSSTRDVDNIGNFKRELLEKVKVLGLLARRAGVRPSAGEKAVPVVAGKVASPIARAARVAQSADQPAHQIPVKRDQPVVLRKAPIERPKVIAIGSSTGGPQALFNVISNMGTGLPQPVVITQHMPPSFTTILAEHIARQCKVDCIEVQDGQRIKPGCYYIAPGDFHMLFETRNGETAVKLSKDPPENFCRPSVDPMLRSLVPIYGKNILTIILTGMGQDGTRGGEAVVNAGGTVIAQDEATSVVWGMPGAAAMSGICSAVMPVGEIGVFVRQIALRAKA
ncbi:MAG: chemotaxis response regulator protein-glutamate methylesterase [Alphaproteobacteria bacterium]|nr:chemotaxis response regulator protein-glutamate methylesterase [Alphaproteobacteria bacterium]